VLYLVTGVLGYYAFGAGVSGDVLKEFSVGNISASVAKGVMAVHIALAFPIVLYPCKLSCSDLLGSCGCFNNEGLATSEQRLHQVTG